MNHCPRVAHSDGEEEGSTMEEEEEGKERGCTLREKRGNEMEARASHFVFF